MPYSLIQATQRTYFIVDDKGKVYNKKPKSKKKCQKQIEAIEARKHSKSISGRGLTLSKAYHDAWILPIRIEVCEISQVDLIKYRQIMNANGIADYYVHEPKQRYFYSYEEIVPVKALKLPYRIYIQDIYRRGGIWFIENKNDFEILCQVSELTGTQKTIVQRLEIEQQPSGDALALPLAPLNPPRPPPRYPSVGFINPPPPTRIGSVIDDFSHVDSSALVHSPRRG
jgi:hypothetical protein